MTVKDIFELRKQGNISEAWEAIQPMFAVHHGPHTSMAYFWTAHDMLKTALQTKNHEATRHLLYNMTQAYPFIDDKDGRARTALILAALKVDKQTEGFNLVYFLPYFEQMSDADWKKQKAGDHWVPSLGERVMARLFSNLEQLHDTDYAAKLVPLLETALRHCPKNTNFIHYFVRLYLMLGNKDKAHELLRHSMKTSHDWWACHKLYELSDDPPLRVALLCQAISWQRREEFRSKMRVELARLLADVRPSNALYELRKSRVTRQSHGNHVPYYAKQLENRLKDATCATPDEQAAFYNRALDYLSSSLRNEAKTKAGT